jgi:hypothetical protein
MKGFLGKLFGGGGLLKDIGDVADRFITTPQQKREFQEAIQERLRLHEQELLKVHAADRADARQREILLRNTLGVWVQNMAAAAIVLCFIALLLISILRPIELTDRMATMVDIMIGSLAGILMQIFQYWFGSSEGSRQKDQRE